MTVTVSIDDVIMRAGLDKDVFANFDQSGPDYFQLTGHPDPNTMVWYTVTSQVPQFAERFTKLKTNEQARICAALAALVPEFGDSVIVEGRHPSTKKRVRVTRTKSRTNDNVHLLLTP